MAALNEYSLPNCNSPVGTFKIKVYSETADITVPTKQTITSIGELEETADRQPSVQEMSRLELSVVDDMTVYPAGFWYTISENRTLVKITLMEGSTETFYFYGPIDNLQNTWEDHYANANSTIIVRSGTLVLTSLERDVFDTVLMQDLQDEVYSHRQNNSTASAVPWAINKVTRVIDIFNSLLVVAGYNSTYSASDTTFVYDATLPDFKFYNYSSDEFVFNQLWFICSIWTAGLVERPARFFTGGTTGSEWTTKYHYVKDFISTLLDNFQLILRFDYDVATGRTKIRLYQRGHAFADAEKAIMPKFSSRKPVMASDTIGTAFKATDLYDTTKFCWTSKEVKDGVRMPSSSAVPDYVSFDSDINCLFRAGTFTYPEGASFPDSLTQYLQVYGSTATENPGFTDSELPSLSSRILGVEYYDFGAASPGYVLDLVSGDGTAILQAVVGYQYGRMATQHKSMVCEYRDITVNNGSTTSHTNARSLMRTDINDGLGSASYWARTVNKNANERLLTVVWIKE